MKILKNLKSFPQYRGTLSFRPLFAFTSKIDTSKNWYKLLQVDKTSTPEDIKKSYYGLAKKYHPDVNKGSDEQFKEINRAYEVLSNEETRRSYDQFLAGDKYSGSVQNTYSNYHYGYNMRGKNRYSRPNEYYYESADLHNREYARNQQFYQASYGSSKKTEYEKRRWEQFYSDAKQNKEDSFDDMNLNKQEYDKFVKKLMFYPMLFMFLYSFLFFLPSRNVSKEFVLFDENTGRVYVTDKETYDEMKRNSFKNQQYSPHSKFPSQMSKETSEYHYALRNRNQVAFNLVDNFVYPPKPSDDEVNKQFLNILKEIELGSEQEEEIKLQPPDTKWKLICRHKQMIEHNSESLSNAADSQAMSFVETIKQNPNPQQLEALRIWFDIAKPDDIKSFLIFDGISELLNLLEVSEMCSRSTKNVSKQLLVLKILEALINNDQVLENLLANPNTAFVVIKNFNPNYVELCTSALEILNAFCWISNEGHSIVIDALNKLKEERMYKYPFQCLIDGLRSAKNIILIENIITFINTLTESPLEEEERTLMRSQFVSCGLKKIYDDIKEKIANDKFNIEDCTFDNSMKFEQEAQVVMSRLSYAGKTSYIERNQDEFEKHLLQIINQIEVFEKAVDDYGVTEIPELVTESSMGVFNQVDFNDINSIFEKLKNESMTNQSFTFFLSIMQQLLVIPNNEKGRELWAKIADVLTKTTGIKNQEGILQISDLKNVLGQTMNMEAMEQKLENLEATVKSREDEIKKLTIEKNKFDADNQRIKKEVEKAEQLLKTFQIINTEFEKKLDEAQKKIKELETALAKNDNKATGQSNESAKISALETKIAALEKQVGSIAQKDSQIAELEKKLADAAKQGTGGPPPLPPPNLLGGGGGNPPPLPPNLLGGPPPLPPPNLLGGPPPLPPNLLGGGGGPPPLPPNLLGGPPPLPPNLLGGGGGPPPLPPNLLGGPPLLPPNLLGGPGGPPPLNLLGKPPPLLGGPPPIGGLPGLGGLANVVQQVMKEKKKPRIPLKGLMWTVIAMNSIKDTVWEKMDDNKVPLDIDFLEKEFAIKKAAEPVVNPDQKKVEEKPKVQKISLLPGEKVKNLEIVLGKLKLSNTALVEALFSIDEKILSLNTVESLLGVIPTEDEIKTVLAYEGDPEMLANPDRFVLEISGVPGFQQRLQALKFTKTYKESVDDLTEKLKKIMVVFENLPKDKRLSTLLENILAIGNYLNGTSARGGAYGFKLDALDKLVDMKMTSNPKKNLLMYVLENQEKKEGKAIIDLSEDFSAYDLGSKLPLSQLQSDLGEIRKGAKFIENAMKKQTDYTNDKVEKFFKEPGQKITKIVEDIDKDLKICEENYQKSCKYLCENPKDSPSDKLLEKVYKFWVNCKNAKAAIEKEKEMLHKEEEKKKKAEEKSFAANQGSNTLTNLNGLKMGNPDEIVEVLRNRRQTKKNLNIGMASAGLMDKAEILKKPVGGVPMGGMQGSPLVGMGMLGQVQLRKVEKPAEGGEKKSVVGDSNAGAEKNQNLAHLSNIMVQGAIRKKTITNKGNLIPAAFQKK